MNVHAFPVCSTLNVKTRREEKCATVAEITNDNQREREQREPGDSESW